MQEKRSRMSFKESLKREIEDDKRILMGILFQSLAITEKARLPMRQELDGGGKKGWKRN